MGLPRHDGEVHGVVTDDNAVLELRVCRRACHAQAHVPKRRRRHGAPSALNLPGCYVILIFLPAAFAHAQTRLGKAAVEWNNRFIGRQTGKLWGGGGGKICAAFLLLLILVLVFVFF